MLNFNFDNIPDDIEIENARVIEFGIGEHCSVNFSITDNAWFLWYVDENGEEAIEDIDIEKLEDADSIEFPNKGLVKKEDIEFFKVTVDSYLKNQKE